MQETTLSTVPRAVISVTEAMESLGLSRAAIYGEINANRLRSFKSGRRRLIPAAAPSEWVAAMEQQSRGIAA